jgi:hypothetical protein
LAFFFCNVPFHKLVHELVVRDLVCTLNLPIEPN